jgi:pSer/pThr/pTyr-binding forkhead associated (FHA) protein
MADPRLNSVHLEPGGRREEFRKARDVLLNSFGEQTRNNDKQTTAAPPLDAAAVINSLADRIPVGAEFVLLDKTTVYQLKIGLNTIGRLSDNDIVIPDPYLSRRHSAILVNPNETCELHDVASKNGTYLNGQRIQGPTRIQSGDEIRMCDQQLIFLRKVDLPNFLSRDATIAD